MRRRRDETMQTTGGVGSGAKHSLPPGFTGGRRFLSDGLSQTFLDDCRDLNIGGVGSERFFDRSKLA
jgi:hypothetical protein